MLVFFWVIKNEIAVGSLPSSERDIVWLRGQGIQAVLSLHPVSRALRQILEELGVEFVQAMMPANSSSGFRDMDQLRELINNWRQAGRPILIHCQMGEVRSRAVAAAYLALDLNSVRQAFALSKLSQTNRIADFVRDYARARLV